MVDRALEIDEPTGRRTDPRPTAPRAPARPTSLKPALFVLGLASAIVVVFVVLSALSTSGPSTPSNRAFAPRSVPGTSLVAVPATTALAPIEQAGDPPANIIDAVAVPRGAVRVSATNNAGNASQYDQQATFSVRATQAQLLAFYSAEIPRLGWSVQSTGPATDQPGTVEVLARKAGDDGWYWELGAQVAPSTFTSSSTGTTDVTLRLYQVPDDST